MRQHITVKFDPDDAHTKIANGTLNDPRGHRSGRFYKLELPRDESTRLGILRHNRLSSIQLQAITAAGIVNAMIF